MGPILIVNYDNLIHNFNSEMTKILTFLGMPVFEDILECVIIKDIENLGMIQNQI